MKYVILILMIIWTWMLMSCQETEYIEVEKLIRDTVKVKEYIDRVFAGVDSTKIPVVVDVPVSVPTRQQDSIVYVIEIQKDTVWMIRVDTLWRERIVYERDTVVVTRHQYDTLWRSSTRLVHYFPSEVIHIIQQFYQDAEAHGKRADVVYINCRLKKLDAVLQAVSYQIDDQWHIYLNDNLTFDEMFLPIYREMARIQFGKEYSQDPESLMYPFYDNNRIRYSNRGQFQTEINQFFQ